MSENVKNAAWEKIDQERLFGENVDIFKNYHVVLEIYNILQTIGVKTSNDNDWFRSLAEYMTVNELRSLYDRILPAEQRKVLASSSRHRTPPEIGEDDVEDILIYLDRNMVFRKKMWRIAAKIFERRLAEYKKILANPARKISAVEKRFSEMRELFGLNELETNAIMAIFIAQTRYCDMGDFGLSRYHYSEKINLLARILGVMEIEVTEMLSGGSNISKYGLVDSDLDLDRTFLAYLAGINPKPLAERFWVEYTGEVLPWEFHGKLAEKYGDVLVKMISSKAPDAGLSVLLYGVPGAGKTSFAASLAARMNKKLYFIAQNDDDSKRMSYSPAFRYAALAVAQKQLDCENCILVVDECDKLVENTGIGGGLFSRFFGEDIAGSRDGESKGQLNSVIDNNKHTVLWICNSKQEAIDPSRRRRFDYNIFFDRLSATSRCCIWKNALKFYGCENSLDESFLQRISSRYPVNPGGIAIAVKNASMICKHDPQADMAKEVLVFLKSHCSLLGIQESPEEFMEPARDYSLEGLNIRSGIKLDRLVEVCRNYLDNGAMVSDNRDMPRLNLLLFGVPGSGKTEFVKYLAKQLNKKLCIKNASDLLDCYVGGTEQRIAAAFSEAEANEEILFIDEGDSLLGARDNAVRSWEVSQVNTLLTEMENFHGIFIVSTNLIQKLDSAALRRFSFRLHFDYLDNNGKVSFFNTYFGKIFNQPELTAEEREALCDIEKLTPSDFRNTRQQFFYLQDANLTNMEIIEALAAEVASKNAGTNYKGLGNLVSKMGF